MIWKLPIRKLESQQRRVGFVSGLSDPTSSALTLDQVALLRALPVRSIEVLDRNFPFTPDGREVAREVSTCWASLMNGWQFWRLRSQRFCEVTQRHWDNLFSQTSHVFLISLSCGLEFIRHGLERSTHRPKLHVIALGPVCRALPDCGLTIIQGERDWLSKYYVRRNDYSIEGLGHLGYTTHPKVLEIICQVLLNNISE